jgi:two-component system, sensor histidine kinase LadS
MLTINTMRQSIFFMAAVLVFWCHPAKAQQPVTIQDEADQHIFTYGELMYLEDPKSSFSIAEISRPLHDKFIVNRLYSPHNVNTGSSYWIRIILRGDPSSKKKWLLEFFDQTIDHIEAYIPNGDGTFSSRIFGDGQPFGQRKFMHKNFEVELTNDTADAREFYFKVRSVNEANIIVVLRSFERFVYYALNEYFLFGLFYGMIVVVAIYNLLMYFVMRERQYIVYILYVLSVGLFTMCSDGIAFQYLWPDHPEWNQKAFGLAIYSVVLWALIFTKIFLHTRSRHPVLNKLITATIILRSSIFLAALFVDSRIFEYRWIEVIPLAVAFYTAVYSYLKGYKAARFFALAYGLLFAGFWVKVLINLDIPLIPGSILTHYSISIGFWFEMWLLSFALADKVRIIKDGKDRALRRIIHQHEVNQALKDKVNRELEHEVVKRTTEIAGQKTIIEQQNLELVSANERLREQASEITRMNSLLDLDNYKLKRSIHAEMLARAGSKNMDYEEFRKIFPDDLTCLRYLEQQKWGNGFACRRCGNDKFHTGRTAFDRRCTRCGYNESPTVFTVFHGIKFPIEKAFYILHLVITERDDLTIDEISATLDLRRNTCWSFKDKVYKLMRRKPRNKGHLAHWENVIFTHEEPVVIG